MQPGEQKGVPPDAASGLAPSRKRRLLGGLKSFGWPLLCLFQLGLIAGAFQFGARLAGPQTSTKPEEASTNNNADAVPVLGASDFVVETARAPLRGRAAKGELDEVDRLIRVGRHELALVLGRSFSERAVAALRDAFLYRLGLCLEGLGRWDEALTSYRKLASHTPSARTAAVALLGQARVWLRMRRPAESKALLCDLIRRSALPELRTQPFLVDARYLLALTAALELLPNEPPGPFNDHCVMPLTSDWSLDRALDWAENGVRSLSGGRKPPEGALRELTPPAQSADATPPAEEVVEVQSGEIALVRLFAHQMSLTGLLDRLAERAALRIEWSARAPAGRGA